jgi:hypothetical protein
MTKEIKPLKHEQMLEEKALVAAAALIIAPSRIQDAWGEDGDD